MQKVGRKTIIILGVLLLFALVGAVTAITAEGCKWRDLDRDSTKDTNEVCEAGWTLHIKVTEGTTTIIEENFVTNTLGSGGKFSYTLPAITAGPTYTVVMTEPNPFNANMPGASWKVVSPSPPTYTKTYKSTTASPLPGFAFGNQEVIATAEGCKWLDNDGDGEQDASETCQADWTLHAKVLDETGAVKLDKDFQTNILGTDGKFLYSLPAPSTGKTWTVTISEIAPDGWVNIVPVGGSYTKEYTALGPQVTGFSFGNRQVAATAEGCKWLDLDKDNTQDPEETCQEGWTLHAKVLDETGAVKLDQDFKTNTLGTGGKFLYSLPAPSTGKTWTVTISEIAPDGWVNIIPVGGSYTKEYTALGPQVTGFSFGNQQVIASAEGCKWIDANKNGQKDDDGTETCQADWTLHATITDDSGKVIKDEDFQTNTLGTGGKFLYALPAPSTGKIWTCTISEPDTPGWVNVVPGGANPGYSRTYSAIDPNIAGFSFGNKESAVPIPEFPTVAVSILTISGMVIAVQFIKKRN